MKSRSVAAFFYLASVVTITSGAVLPLRIRKYRIPKLEPLRVDQIKVDQDQSAAVGINLVAHDIDIHGVSQAQLKDMDIQVDPPVFKMKFFFPRVELLAKYKISGKVLILPIQGKGDANITMVNLDLEFGFDAEWVKKENGVQYLKMKDHYIKYDTTRNYIKLDNLFNGNKALGDRLNEFIDVNWREVTQELGPPFADAIALVIRRIVSGILEQVPRDNIFPEKA
ncbi:protein takeout-like isoform X2 [Ischnura elegans]|uniref:protein takeout-like isoform X2 n=1 Tax=Ischnura elegans TaxID=197161 RepID=UPI001ED8A1B9|nr:protein takeout-like isoform X2 [Ischnura elegans]